MDRKMESLDVVVIGAGFAGLSAAKTYLQCAPETNLVILDLYSTIGGVWAKERLYPTLHSNNQLGTFEYPDYPMHEGFGVKPKEHISGQVAHDYIYEYAKDNGLQSRIRFRSKVTTVTKNDDGTWQLVVEEGEPWTPTGRTYQVQCTKLIVATGLTSQAEPMSYKGQENFGAPILSSAVLATEGVELTKEMPEKGRQITVLGGSKSGYDSVYMFASRGFKVNWVIRKSGYGSTWMAPSHIKVPGASLWVERVPCIRALSWFSPCMWSSEGSWARSFLHGTALGRAIVTAFWGKLGGDIIEQTGLSSDPELSKLIPDQSCFWYASSLAILNYDTPIHDYIRSGQVKIYREDVLGLADKAIKLADGTSLSSPAGLVTATNWSWKPNVDFQPESLHAELGIPSASYSEDQKAFWSSLDDDADKEIFQRYPVLINSPKHGKVTAASGPKDAVQDKAQALEPYRLYRFAAPPGLTAKGDRSVVFVGYIANTINVIRNGVAGLWSYAYLNDKLALDEQDVYWQSALMSRFCRKRYPFGHGAHFPDFVFEQVPFLDQMLRDLGLSPQRKGSWWREWFEPYGPEDYRNLTEEWLQKQKA